MRIQHNIPALNAHRNLSNNNNQLSGNLEKLSSGYRINRAGDDAAGLAISEKMRAQVTGLEAAQKNAEDGVSLVQTAEGALTEVHSMLNRMVGLAIQSANGTYSTGNRMEMQKEIDALMDEIDRISEASNFNGQSLFEAKGITGAVAAPAPTTVTIGLHVGETGQDHHNITVTLTSMHSNCMLAVDSDGNTAYVSLRMDASGKALTSAKMGGITSSVDITTAAGAKDSISMIGMVIDGISSMRAEFGALQNRLEHTINNLSVQHENITSAESRIRDVDMAKEMMAYTKNNILIQASQSMLAQANMVPQGILQLLQ